VLIISFMPEGLVPGSARLARWAWQGLRARFNGAGAARPVEERGP